ncbi:PTS system mannose/fructose/sorbose family transporter subunit IID [Cytobacillus sp. Hz8]|uniref:PTS system mannose/fructose/sorbose family transporter subunit IID n=1 Tax=Cytobacillus sp. Hz8 TaxID=3347168 RepID=UPI0035D7FAED
MRMENMKTETENMNPGILSKRDLLAANIRWLLCSQICWNYERMMSTGYLYSILPTLKKLYKKDEDLKEMMDMHNQFFNTNPMVGGLILGMDMAIEEREQKASKEVVAGLKTGLMGPFAGVGDTIFGVIIPTIFGSIASYMALKGNGTGVLIWVLVNILIVGLRFTLLPIGYKQGAKLVNEFANRLNALTEAAVLLGITVVGALIPTVVNAKVPLVYKSGEVSLKIQDMLDQIMPSLVPILLVGLIYMLLGRKKMNSTKAILFVMVLGIVLYNLKILG